MPKDDLSDEDKALFRQTVGPVTPLKKGKVEPSKKSLPMPSPAAAVPLPSRSLNSPLLVLSDSYANPVAAESILSFGAFKFPAKHFLKLKQGQIPIQGRLDLHGCWPDEAKNRLIRFIAQQTLLKHRCILVIHGKGSLRGEPPVLKNLVNHWLSQLPQVLAFHSALPKEGGAGAVYVLLKSGSHTEISVK